jgi:hypothetical protein
MSLELGMLLSLAIVLLGGLAIAGIVVLLRKLDRNKPAETDSSAGKSVEQKK